MRWQEELQHNIHTIEAVKKYIHVPDLHVDDLQKIIDIHPMSIPRYYMSLIDKNDPNDPIMKMIIPSMYEFDMDGSYDTSGELDNTVVNGLQHKYKNTALITTTNQCTAYCRYCFRKRVVGLPDENIKTKIKTIAEYVRETPVIHNVLVSGGDPMVLDNGLLRYILDAFASIDSLDFIRFGTKIPVVFPQRILEDDEMVAMFSQYANRFKQIYIVTHFNHPKEITDQSTAAIAKLRNAGLIINNQAVLMKGINDTPQVLEALLRGLIRIGVNPYYVFQCRPVKRVKKNFQVTLQQGIEVVEQTRARLDGHSKRFKYIMSHRSGKIEILGLLGDEILLKYHQAQDFANHGKLIRRPLHSEAAWLDDLSERCPTSVL
ncbi:KamA family radical SAM protein [bacterium]|nr:KamA family radical SAM protein [bacterium]